MKQLRGFKYRFYPNSAQRLELAQTFGCTRFVYNWALALRTNSYYEEQKSLTYTDTSNALTKLKKDPEKTWLKQVSSVPLQQGLRNLNKAFEAFFKGRTKYPRFKKKSGKQSATYAANAFAWRDGKLTLAKMQQPLKIRWSRKFEGEPKQVSVSKDPAGRYFVSFLVEEELKQFNPAIGFADSPSEGSRRTPVRESIGIDLGVKDVMVTSKGMKSGNPKYFSKYQARLKTLQRRLAKKQKGSSNRYKARLKVAKLHAKIADCRKDFLHKLTTRLVAENQSLYVETLAVKNLMANHKLAKAIADCGWGEALRQLQYKCQWHKRTLTAIDRWFPSSKRCSSCGYILDQLPLSVRKWTCPNNSCRTTHLRDVNAAKNILAVGQTVMACGDTSGGETSLLSLAMCQ